MELPQNWTACQNRRRTLVLAIFLSCHIPMPSAANEASHPRLSEVRENRRLSGEAFLESSVPESGNQRLASDIVEPVLIYAASILSTISGYSLERSVNLARVLLDIVKL